MGAFATMGDVVGGRYRLIAPLGRGGMGAVYAAEHVELGTRVAVKLIDSALAASVEARERFRREARAAASLKSPHIVQILDFGVDGETPYLAMELLEGEPLRARIERLGRLSPLDVVRVIDELARGLAKAHAADIVHRDLKPDNVFLADVEGQTIVKVLDFGVAQVPAALAPSHLTRTGAALGTPLYMSPEQLEGRPIDLRSDLWSLGVIAFECLCGRVPFAGDTIGQLVLAVCAKPLPVPSTVAPVPAAFDAWFARAASRDPGGRFPSARALADALREAVDSPAAHAATVAIEAKRPTTSARGGDERAGFEVSADVAARLFSIRLWGLWDMGLAKVYLQALISACAAFGGPPWCTLADARRFPPQKPEIAQMLREAREAGLRAGVTRSATVVEGAVSRMQILRLFEGTGIELQVFTDIEEARTWLARG